MSSLKLLFILLLVGCAPPNTSYNPVTVRRDVSSCNKICQEMADCNYSDSDVSHCKDQCRKNILSDQCIDDYSDVSCDSLRGFFNKSNQNCFPTCLGQDEYQICDDKDVNSLIRCNGVFMEYIDCRETCFDEGMSFDVCGTENGRGLTNSYPICFCLKYERT